MRGTLAIAIALAIAGCATTRSAVNTVGSATTGVVGAAATGATGIAGAAAQGAVGTVGAVAGGTTAAVGAVTGTTAVSAKGTPQYLEVGRAQYMKYCATCHGPTGTGDGIAASTFNKHPGDLTLLARRNGGRFPMMNVVSIVKGDTPIAAHGTREMPVWGEIIGQPMGDPMYRQDAADAKIMSIASYIESVQR